MRQDRTIAYATAITQVGISHDAVSRRVRKASVASLGDSFAQIPDQGARNHRWQGGAHDNAALGTVHFDGLQINPADDADELVADLNRDAFHKVARNRLGLAHAGRAVTITAHVSLQVAS